MCDGACDKMQAFVFNLTRFKHASVFFLSVM